MLHSVAVTAVIARASFANTWNWHQALKPLEIVIEHLAADWKEILVKYLGFLVVCMHRQMPILCMYHTH